MRASLTIGSLFSGIGGLELGLEEALHDGGFDVSTTWQCESDEWCRGILARHWPDALRYDDVRTLGEHNAPRVDILCGGFPCQDVSYAGRGAGLAGARSGLWFEFARVTRELRPRIVVVENVAALLSRGLDTVLGDLSEAGYDAVWFDVRASDVGAPHRRERLFIVAWRRDVADRDGGGCERERLAQHADESSARGREPHGCGARGRRDGSSMADALGEHAQRRGRPGAVARASGGAQGESKQRQRSGDAARGGGEAVGLADARRGRPSRPRHDQRPVRATSCGDGEANRPVDVGGGVAESFVGGAADGLPRGVDLAAHRWPAGPGEAQHEGEPPRVTTERRERRQRLKALGNSVVPQVGYAIGCVVAEVLR